MKSKHSFIYAFLIIIIGILIFGQLSEKNKAQVLIENHSGEIISELSIHLDLYPAQHSVKGLNPNGSFLVAFYDFSDSQYILKGKLNSGIEIGRARIGVE